jgi:hypothetical protein
VGLAHEYSDIDLAVLLRSGAVRLAPTHRVDADDMNAPHLEYFFVDDVSPARFEHDLAHSILDSNIIAGRVGQGIVVHDVDGTGSALLRAYEAWVPPPWLWVKLIGETAGLLNDALGARTHAPDRAEVALRFAAHTLAKANLISVGCYYLAPKMQLELLDRAAPDQAARMRVVLGLDGLALDHRLDVARDWFAEWRRSIAARLMALVPDARQEGARV